jgi:hypothetical protein
LALQRLKKQVHDTISLESVLFIRLGKEILLSLHPTGIPWPSKHFSSSHASVSGLPTKEIGHNSAATTSLGLQLPEPITNSQLTSIFDSGWYIPAFNQGATSHCE